MQKNKTVSFMYTEKESDRNIDNQINLAKDSEKKQRDKIYIRADMNEIIATGHIMRCLAVADAAKEMGKETIFITADEKPVEMLRSRGYEPIILHTEWNNMESELESLILLIQKESITKLLVDSYQVTKEYLAKLEKYTEVYYLDDLDAFEYVGKALYEKRVELPDLLAISK